MACCELCEDTPGADCQCGFYSLKSPEPELATYNSDIIGQVLVWGKVIDGERGYRSKYASVELFLLPSIEPLGEDFLNRLSLRYNTPLIKAHGPILKVIELKRKFRLAQRGELRVVAAIDQYKRDYAWKNKREYVPDYKTTSTSLG